VIQQAGYDRFTVDLATKTASVPGGERNTLAALLAEAGYPVG
jgi:hypothetical protein